MPRDKSEGSCSGLCAARSACVSPSSSPNECSCGAVDPAASRAVAWSSARAQGCSGDAPSAPSSSSSTDDNDTTLATGHAISDTPAAIAAALNAGEASVNTAQSITTDGTSVSLTYAEADALLDSAQTGTVPGDITVTDTVTVAEAGDVLVNDPAADGPASVPRTYHREDLERCWMRRGGVAYAIGQ